MLQAASADVAASLGSACHSEHDTVNGVLASHGSRSVRAAGAVRLSAGAMTSEEGIIHVAAVLIKAWQQLAHQ
ncbi:MAG: hypothetical protein HY028_00760 [Gammaproteobacteria bacterium]|nr:hypothetical protein [Gammaproteobacteria bacterium]